MQDPVITFICGAIILVLFFYYLGTTAYKTKKTVGTILTLAVSLYCIWAWVDLGIKKGIDLGGGSSFTVQLQPALDDEGNPKFITNDSVQQAIGILEKRLNPDGGKDLFLAPQGSDRILIQMPGISPEEVEKVRTDIQKVALLEFRLVHPNSAGALSRIKATGGIEPGYVEMPAVKEKDGPTSYLVKSRPDLEGRYLSNAGVSIAQNGGWAINMQLDSEGSKRFEKLSGDNIGTPLAIIVDGEVISAPNLRGRISGGRAEITGTFTEEEARSLASALQNPLENPMKIIMESNVSASFGEQTIQQGIYTGYVSAVLIGLFMVIYYRFAGLIALIGLAVCMLLVFGAMALFGFTLTMPGIAGLVLTMGMAVDANVLIYERLREEIKAGKSLSAALEASFEKAFSAIFDANVTTLISAVVLFYLASGQVRGFAVTLTVGVIGTLLGSLIVTRVVFNWFIDSGVLKTITVTQLIPERVYNVLAYSKHFIIATLILTAISIGVFFVKGKDAIGIDFRGGALTQFDVKNTEVASVEAVEKALRDAGLQGFYVQESTTGTGELLTVRSEYEDGTRVKSLLEEKFPEQVSGGQVERVGSVVGSELAKSSMIAYALAMLGMFIYLIIFYDTSFAVAAIVALFHDCVIAIGLAVVFGQELSVIHIGALLTIAGYSLNDTIIVFDRIREMLKTRTGSMRQLMNEAISATLSRTLLTSVTVLMAMVVLHIFGGPAMQEFALPIIIGVLVGTYSSIYIAAPLVLLYARLTGKNLQEAAQESEASEVKSLPA